MTRLFFETVAVTVTAWPSQPMLMTEKHTIWIVDDDPSVRKAIKRLLQSAGYPSRTFASAREFFDANLANRDGILVLDVRIPGMNGLEMQKHLAASGSDIPIIFITAHEDPRAKAIATSWGAIAFILKPFNDQTLLDAIKLAGQANTS